MTLKVSKKQTDAVRVSRRQYDDYLGIWLYTDEVEYEEPHVDTEKAQEGVQSIVGSLVADTALFVCMLLSSTTLVTVLGSYVSR